MNMLKKASLLMGLGVSSLGLSAQELKVTDDFSLKLDARFTIEARANITSDKEFSYEGNPFTFANGARLTQSRLGVVAKLYKNWEARMDAEVVGGKLYLRDNWMKYSFSPKQSLALGYMKDPLGFEHLTASKFMYIENATPVTFLTHGRFIALSWSMWDTNYLFTANLSGPTMNDRGDSPLRGNDGYGIAARAAYIPFNDAYKTLHLGVYGSHHVTDEKNDVHAGIAKSGGGETGVHQYKFNTILLPIVDSYNVMGVELAFKYDRLLVRGEYLGNHYRYREVASADLRNIYYQGFYTTINYTLIGNQRTYNRASGTFATNVAKGGNLDLFTRISYLDAEHHPSSPVAAAINGGKTLNWTLGASWMPNRNVTLTASYLLTHLSEQDNRMGALSWKDNGNLHGLQCRAQICF